MSDLSFKKNEKVSVYLYLKQEGVVIDKFIKNKRINQFFKYSQFLNLIKNGNHFNFPLSMLEDFLQKNQLKLSELTQVAKSKADFDNRWHALNLQTAKEKGNIEDEVFYKNQIERNLRNF